jgi:hypothetical protein
MRNPLIAIGSAVAVASVLALAPLPAAAASCQEMYDKAEQMVGLKKNLGADKKMKAYKMAADSYSKCSQAVAMTDGGQRAAMMKSAEQEFEKTYDFIRDVE